MARTPSNMIELGSKAPDFKLLNTIDNKLISSNDLYKKEGVLIMFICNHCPFVIHVIDEIVNISKEYENSISFIAISSNDVINYPDDAPELMKKLAIDKSFNFPYLISATFPKSPFLSACSAFIFKCSSLKYFLLTML